MRAYGYTEHGGPEKQDYLDLPDPEAGPAELLVAVHAAGVNPVDMKIRSGAFGAGELPAVFGREVSGVVKAVGQDVDHFSVGDEVLGQHRQQQAVVAGGEARVVADLVAQRQAEAAQVAGPAGALSGAQAVAAGANHAEHGINLPSRRLL